MSSKTFFAKKTIFAFLIFAFSLFCTIGLLTTVSQAQPGSGSELEYPILTDHDFQVFLKVVNGQAEADPAKFLIDNNVDEDHMEKLAVKMAVNAMARRMGNINEVAKQMGQSIVFTPEESKLYDKYASQIDPFFDQIVKDNQ
jgi:hypothetical protein